MTDLLAAMYFTNDPSYTKQYFIKEEHDPLSSLIRRGMELFVVGHEFGHIYRGHLGDFWKKRLSSEITDLSESHLQELEADIIGCALAVDCMVNAGFDKALAYASVESFMNSMIFCENSIETISGKTIPRSSHPSFSLRKKSCRFLMEHEVKEKEEMDSINSLCEFYDFASFELTKAAASALKKRLEFFEVEMRRRVEKRV